MKKESRELLLRAIGIIEGLSFSARSPISLGLEAVSIMLEDVLKKEADDIGGYIC